MSENTKLDLSCSPINKSRKEVYLTPNKRAHPNNIEQLNKMIDNCVKMEC